MAEQIDKQLAERLTQALTAGSEVLFQLILDPDPNVLANTLKNPQLNEEHLLTLLKRRDLPEEIPEKIYHRHSKSLSHRLALALAKNRATADTIVRTLLPQLHLFELVDICFLPGLTADKRLNAERNILQRLPTTPLGSKLTLARRATANIVAELLKEGHPALTKVCLDSPRLKEAAIYQLLTGPKATAETISIIARNSRWQHRPNLRQAILRNPQTPEIWFTLWLPRLSLPLLKQLNGNQQLRSGAKRQIKAELNRRGAGK